MQTVVILDRSSKHFSRFLGLLKNQQEIRIKDVKKLVAHSSYYAMILKKMFGINKLLKEINPAFYLAEPTFDVTPGKDVFTVLKRCPSLVIEEKHGFFLLRCTNEQPQNNQVPSRS